MSDRTRVPVERATGSHVGEHHRRIIRTGIRRGAVQRRGQCRSDLTSARRDGERTARAGLSGRRRMPLRTLEQRDGVCARAADRGASMCARRAPLCTWTASSDVDWISINYERERKGFGISDVHRRGDDRPAASRARSPSPDSISASRNPKAALTRFAESRSRPVRRADRRAVTVTAGAGCPWTAASNATVAVGRNRVGIRAQASWSVTAAPTSGPSRTGNVTIAGQLFTVTQSPGCSFDVSPLSLTVDPAGGTRTYQRQYRKWLYVGRRRATNHGSRLPPTRTAADRVR